jgi:DNA-binding beta-propeller fold protein YncE
VRTSSTTGADPNDSNDTSPPLNPTNYSNEPVGVAFNPENGFCFISDDDKNEVFVINPGADGDCFTLGDNTVTSFDTSTSPAFASLPATDPEGLGFDPGPTPSLTDNSLYIGDGTNREVYRLRPGSDGVFTGSGDDTVTDFDTEALGITVPDGIECVRRAGSDRYSTHQRHAGWDR